MGVLPQTKGIKFFIRHRLFDVVPKQTQNLEEQVILE